MTVSAANYTVGLSWDGDYKNVDVNYEGDLNNFTRALKLDFIRLP